MSHQYRTNVELQQIARDLVNGLIFCDWQIQKDADVHLIFQAITLMTEAQNLELQTKDIGMMYEYRSEAVDPDADIPVFFSLQILTKKESLIVAEYFERYKKIADTDKEVEI